jgi:anti-sigma factor RsiW
LNCNRVIIEISNYIDGNLDAAVRQEIEIHLHSCEDCTIIVNQTRLTVEIFCGSEAAALPQDVRSRLHEALHRKLRRPGP